MLFPWPLAIYRLGLDPLLAIWDESPKSLPVGLSIDEQFWMGWGHHWKCLSLTLIRTVDMDIPPQVYRTAQFGDDFLPRTEPFTKLRLLEISDFKIHLIEEDNDFSILISWS